VPLAGDGRSRWRWWRSPRRPSANRPRSLRLRRRRGRRGRRAARGPGPGRTTGRSRWRSAATSNASTFCAPDRRRDRAGGGSTRFLEALDPMKVYFLKSDIDAFTQAPRHARRSRTAATWPSPTRCSRGSCSGSITDAAHRETARHAPGLHQGRIDRRRSQAISVATSEAEAEDTWRKRIKYDLLVQKMEKTPPQEAKEKLLPPVSQLRQADASDDVRRTARDLPLLAHQQPRSPHQLHVARHAGEISRSGCDCSSTASGRRSRERTAIRWWPTSCRAGPTRTAG